jgi:hypothetical protein
MNHFKKLCDWGLTNWLRQSTRQYLQCRIKTASCIRRCLSCTSNAAINAFQVHRTVLMSPLKADKSNAYALEALTLSNVLDTSERREPKRLLEKNRTAQRLSSRSDSLSTSAFMPCIIEYRSYCATYKMHLSAFLRRNISRKTLLVPFLSTVP